jgi:hypothetical protein
MRCADRLGGQRRAEIGGSYLGCLIEIDGAAIALSQDQARSCERWIVRMFLPRHFCA